MQRFVRRKDRPQPGRGPARWTAWEIVLMALSIVLIVFPLYAEGYRWLNPLAVPAAPLLQRATFTSVATSPGGATATTGAATATTGAATATTGAGTATATTGAATATTGAATATTGAATATTGAATATATTAPIASSTPTNGPSPTPTA